MKRSAGAAVAVAVVAAAFGSGCGWLAASRPVAARNDPPQLSHAALVREVQAACMRRKQALASIPRPRAPKQAPAFFARVAAITRSELGELVALRPSRRDEREFARLLSASGEVALSAARFHAAVVHERAHERRRAQAAAERASATYDRAAARLGVACRQAA